MIDHLSYSSISGYLQCSKHWKYRYIDQVPTESSDALLFGSAWHKMIGLVVDGDTPSDAWLCAHTETFKEHESNLFDLGIKMLQNPNINLEIAELKPREIEYKFEAHFPGVPVPVIGFIDMITQDGHVIDFKTAGRKWTQDRADNDLQPTFYLAALNKLGLVELPATFRYMIFTKTKNPEVQVIDTTRTAADVLALYALVKEVWDAIEMGVYVPSGIGNWKCSSNYCEFWNLCEGGRR
jgi:hypothetical protein